MKPVNLSELSTTELTAKGKTLKTVLGAFMSILSVLAVGIILLFMQGQNTIALPLLFLQTIFGSQKLYLQPNLF
jgi:hypothetical protein